MRRIISFNPNKVKERERDRKRGEVKLTGNYDADSYRRDDRIIVANKKRVNLSCG